MKTELKFSVVVLTLTMCNLITVLNGSTVDSRPVNSELDGKELIKMGQVLNKPLLILLGKTFVKMKHSIEGQILGKIDTVEKTLQDDIKDLTEETAKKRETLKTELCTLKLCTDWTEWSACSTDVFGTFGASTRSRTCGGRSSICPATIAEEVELDSRVCQGPVCKSNYILTTNRFCVRLINTERKSWTAAQDNCHQDGGHLINVDSKLKARDVNETLQEMSLTNDFWIDGRRTLPNGEWMYQYGVEDTGFSNWWGTEPGLNDDCKAYVYYSSSWYWFGRPCTTKYYFMCEMV